MGIYRRKDKEGKHYGPWYIKYPREIDPVTGKIKYTIHKVGFSKKFAELAFAKSTLEWQKKKHLGVCRRTPNNFKNSVNCSLKIEKSW